MATDRQTPLKSWDLSLQKMIVSHRNMCYYI